MMKAMAPSSPVPKDTLERWARIDREKLHEVNRAELDRIRQKLSTGGPGGLTPQERAFLGPIQRGRMNEPTNHPETAHETILTGLGLLALRSLRPGARPG